MPSRRLPAEGWYLDPFERHQDRWFSNGRPTSLVRDEGLESHDAAPVEESSAVLESTAW